MHRQLRLLVAFVVLVATVPVVDAAALSQPIPVTAQNGDDVAALTLIHSVVDDGECRTVAKPLDSLVAGPLGLAVLWCARATNVGTVALTDVQLNAPDISDVLIDMLGAGQQVLLPGESALVEIAGTIPRTGLISNALASGVPSDADGNPIVGQPEPQDIDNAAILEASMTLDASATPGPNGDCAISTEALSVFPGTIVTWCYAVVNTGRTNLLVTEIADPALGVIVPIAPANQRLGITDVGQVSVDVPATRSLTTSSIVAGTPLGFDDQPLEVPRIEATDSAQVFIVGDVNCDGEMNGLDALAIAQFVAGTRPGGDCPVGASNRIDVASADVIRDGVVANNDVQAVLACLVDPRCPAG